jgi:hypothetical protein
MFAHWHARRLRLWSALLVGAVLSGRAVAEEPVAVDGLVVPIPATITTDAKNQIKNALDAPLQRYRAERGKDPRKAGVFWVVCSFNGDGKPNASDDYGACWDLANFLLELRNQDVQTVAYVQGTVTRHAVLPVLACSEIVMSREAHLGQVASPGRWLKNNQRQAYEDMARGHFSVVLVRKMFDPGCEVLKMPPDPKGKSERYIDGHEHRPPGGERVPFLGPNEVALYTFEQASEVGLCRAVPRQTIEEVMGAYNLPPSALHQSLEALVGRRVVVAGPLNGELSEKVQRRLRRALGSANLIILQLECFDSDPPSPQAAHDLGLYLAKINDDRPQRPVRIVAFVTNKARNTAALVALGCGEIVMQRQVKNGDTVEQEGAVLGGFDRLLKEHPDLGAKLRSDLIEVARKQGRYPPQIAEALAAPELRLYAVSEVKDGATPPRFLTEEEMNAEQKANHAWRSVETIKPRNAEEENKSLTLSAERASKLRLAREASSFEEVCKQLDVSPSDVRTIDTDFLDSLADFLRDPWTSMVLVMLGITCMILEMKMPGVVAPGCVAAICFVLFFWSHSQLNGQITWLALLLFILGLLLIGLEVFVIPGFGFAGVSGIVLVIGSLGLVAYGHWPQSSGDWLALGQQIVPFGLSLLGALVCAFILAHYLPSIPYVNRLILQPQDETAEGFEEAADPIHADLAALLGAIGVAATPLRPAGKAQFGDEFVDVVAEGSYVTPGTRVQVIEIEGNRVVVKEV